VISVVNGIEPPVISYANPAFVLTEGSPVQIAAPLNSGGKAVSYSISPALPSGLSLDPAMGVISGTPAQASLAAQYQVTASNSGGVSSTPISLTVKPSSPPELASTFSDHQLFSQPVVLIPISVTSETQVTTTILVNGVQAFQSQATSFTANLTLNVGTNAVTIQAVDSFGEQADPIRFTDLVFNPPALNSGISDPAVISPAFNMPATLSNALLDKLSLTTSVAAKLTGRTDPFVCSQSVPLSPPSSQLPLLTQLDSSAQVTPDIQSIANQLGSPDQAYFYVRDQIALLPRFGLTQTASQTIQSGVGTAADKAAVLIAVFRAMNIPAQYVAGDILVDEAQLKSMYGVIGTDDLAWAQYMALKGYFQMLNPSGFDGTSMVSYQNGSRAWQIPHVWVYAALELQPGNPQWIQIDPSSGMTDYYPTTSSSVFQFASSAVTNISDFIRSPAGSASLADVLAMSLRSLDPGLIGLAPIGPSVLNRYSVIPAGSISVTTPCIKTVADLLPQNYQFRSHVRATDPSANGATLIEAELPLASLSSQPVSLTFQASVAGGSIDTMTVNQGSTTIASGSAPAGQQFSLYHAIQEPLAYGGLTEARIVNGRPVGGVFVIRHAVAPISASSYYTDLKNAQAALTLGASGSIDTSLINSAGNQSKIISLLQLGSTLALTKAASNDSVINSYRGISRATEHLLLSGTPDQTLVASHAALFGAAPASVAMDWDMTGPIYSRTGNYSDFTQYRNIANAKGELIVANSTLEGQVWNDLFGSGGTSAIQLLQQAYPKVSNTILGTALTPSSSSTIEGQLSPALAAEVPLLQNFAAESPYVYTLTDLFTASNGWTGTAFIIVPSNPLGQAGAYLLSQGNGALLGGSFVNTSCTYSDNFQTSTCVGQQGGSYYDPVTHVYHLDAYYGDIASSSYSCQSAHTNTAMLLCNSSTLFPSTIVCSLTVTSIPDCNTANTHTETHEWITQLPISQSVSMPGVVSNQTLNFSPNNTRGSQTSCNLGKPVNIASGSMWHDFVDFSVPGRTEDTTLLLKRTYTTKPTQASNEFGNGWWHNLETQIVFGPTASTGGGGCFIVPLSPDAQAALDQYGMTLPLDQQYIDGCFVPDTYFKSLVWIDEDGGPWTFVRQPDFSLTAPAGLGATITETSNQIILKKRNGTKLTFSNGDTGFPSGKLESIIEPHGETIQLAYDANGKLASATTALAGTITFSRNEAGLVTNVTRQRDGLNYQYTYNSDGKLASSSDFDGNTTTYQYNTGQVGTRANGLLSSITDPLHRTTNFSYYDDGRAFEQTEPGNGYWGFFYSSNNGNGNYVSVKGGDGTVTQFSLDSNGLVNEIVYPDQSRAQFNIQPNGSTVKTDETGAITSWTYDNAGNLTRILKPNGAITRTQSDPYFGKPEFVQTPAGNVSFGMDPATGNITSVRQSETGLTLNLGYDSFGNVTSVSNGLGSYTNVTDQNGLLTTVFDARNPETRTYDSRGRVATRTFQSGRILTYTWDDHDRITRMDDSAGPSIIQTWDAVGRLTSRAVAAGMTSQVTSFGYDDRDRLISITDATNRTTQIKYDKVAIGCNVVDKPSMIIDPAGRKTQFFYDLRQRLTRMVDPNGGVTRYDYNARGDLTGVTDPMNHRTQFSYDPNGRVIERDRPSAITQPDGSAVPATEVTQYDWDLADRLLSQTVSNSVNSTTQVTTYSWDPLSRLISKRLILQREGQAAQVQDDASYTYQPQLDAVRLATANNQVAQLSFNSEAVPPFATTAYSVVSTDANNSLQLIQDTYTIIPAMTGDIASITNSAGNTVFTAQYDPAGRLLNIASGNIIPGQSLGVTLSYDSFGRKNTVTSTTGLTGTYSFDLLNRMTSVNWSGADGNGANLAISEVPSYDPLTGNISSITREFGTFNYTQDPMDQLLAVTYSGTQPLGAAANRSFLYDFNGNRKLDSIRGPASFINNVLTGDALSSFMPSTDGSGSVAAILDKASGSQKSLAYRVDGRVSSYSDSTFSASYAFDALGRRVSKTITQGTNSPFNQSYVYLADSDHVLLAQSGNGYTHVYLDSQGLNEHLGEVSSNAVNAYASDHLGSVLNADAAGNAHAFGAFGENLGNVQEITTSSNPVIYGFAGMLFDPESVQYHTLWRGFDSNTGRWFSTDPIGFAGGDYNIHRYAQNNPLSLIDPMGLDVSVGNTPAVGGFHQKIFVDTPDGQYGQSFGMKDRNSEMQGSSEAASVNPKRNQTGSGIVYQDNDPVTKIQRTFKTNRDEDAIIKAYLQNQLGNTGPYNVMTNNCRDYSNTQFDTIVKMISESRKGN
jgi:RHS repeat-associated protein